ncbi:MAG TPA: hypothetical protein VM580_29430 [Labilithrix sp.]|nr:hypothetical protein [Labilithrix sp.]
MPNWMTAEEIGERYVVGPERLQAFAARGNLACRKPEGAPMLFDEASVARLFRPRYGGIAVTKPAGNHLGVLGVSKLGDEPARARRRRRVSYSDVVPAFPGAEPMVLPLSRKRA